MESDLILTIEDWPIPQLCRDIPLVLGFANFYRRFFRNYAKITFPWTALLRKMERARAPRDSEGPLGPAPEREWTREGELARRKLKKPCTEAPILQHFDLAKPINLQPDACGFAIAGILNQYDAFRTLQPVNFYSRKGSPAEQNNDPYDRELLPIVETMKQWRHYLEGANHRVLIQCDHKNLEYFQTSKVLTHRQARWAEILSSYDFVIEHLAGIQNRQMDPLDYLIMRLDMKNLPHGYWLLWQRPLLNRRMISYRQAGQPSLPTHWPSTYTRRWLIIQWSVSPICRRAVDKMDLWTQGIVNGKSSQEP